MPKNVRNFWIDVRVDGASDRGAGPRGKEGGMSAEIYIRDDGAVKKAVSITGREKGGRLILSIHCLNGEFIQIETSR